MFTLIISIVILILGYIFYGKFVEKYFGIDKNRKTPAIEINDGVDFVVMPLWKIYIIQFLNIAGLGPIFGAILGAAYGPMAYLWIVIGCIFMGATHDYFSGMLSLQNNGASLPELVGKYLGKGTKYFLRFFTLILLVLVGVAFISGPAKLLAGLTNGGIIYWMIGIFVYYIIATLFPIDKIIGKIYPIFGAILIIMAIMIFVVMIKNNLNGILNLHEFNIHDFKNFHDNPMSNILYPMLFVVISCGAISGFHATQSPLMSRCLKNEKQGKFAFYGAMITEGIIAMIWATAAMNYFGTVDNLNATLAVPSQDPAWIVNEICNSWLGKLGAIIAIIGVVVCPITSGDTAFRSARLIIADSFNIQQKSIVKRILTSLPIFAVGFILTFFFKNEFGTLWKYVGISNQILAAITLWTVAMYFALKKKNHLIVSIPAFFLTIICFTYLLIAPNTDGGLALNHTFSYIFGVVLSVIIAAIWYLYYRHQVKQQKI
ncbi:MAG: carbon starvation protein A [Bacteroidales bacterium]|jgi:carbon starvation protein CstA|nr:carbon starvation protein A [Bacteroidales bacterium]